MKIGISVGSAYYDGGNWSDIVQYVEAADRLGVDSVWSAEAWGMESVTSLAFLAARTENIRLGTGIMQISARTPAMAAMTAMSMAQISNDRFLLGLGVSGPQVVEGLHGDGFAQPLRRLREYIEICRMAMAGERVIYDGDRYELPRKGGEGKALKVSIPPKPELPIYLATLGPKMLELTGELADGWLGTSFIAEHADVMLDPIRRGAERAGRTLDDIDLHAPGSIAVSEDVDKLIDAARPGMAFTLGGWAAHPRTSTTTHTREPATRTSPRKFNGCGSRVTRRQPQLEFLTRCCCRHTSSAPKTWSVTASRRTWRRVSMPSG